MERSISDDDLCATCAHCKYNPGDMSECDEDWPGISNADGYVISCEQYQEKYPSKEALEALRWIRNTRSMGGPNNGN